MMGGGLKKDKKFIAKICKQLLDNKRVLTIVDDKLEKNRVYTVLSTWCLDGVEGDPAVKINSNSGYMYASEELIFGK